MSQESLCCERLDFPSADGVHTTAAYLYTQPGVPLRGVIQLAHGMCEYVERYRDFAAFFAQNGYAVAGNDHLGHGRTAAPGELGSFGPAGSARFVLDDLLHFSGVLRARFPSLPLILYGHSMGSFFARWYAAEAGARLDGLVLSGTAGPSAAYPFALALARLCCLDSGGRRVSKFMTRMAMGGYTKRIPGAASRSAWLSRDEAVVRAYEADPLCHFSFTAGAYREMLTVLCRISRRSWAGQVPKGLPVLLAAGGEDPVGSYGAGVREVWARLGDAGLTDLECYIDPDGRHELHNELNREQTLAHVLGWLDQHWGAAPGEETV